MKTLTLQEIVETAGGRSPDPSPVVSAPPDGEPRLRPMPPSRLTFPITP